MNENVKKFLELTGIYGAIISAIAYLVITWVIVQGFESSIDRDKQIMFAILGAVIGLIISFSLRGQGVTFAKKEPKSVKVMQQYHEIVNKTKTIKQLKTIKYHLFVATIKDVVIKGVSIGTSTYFLLYIFMEGNGDFGLFLLAISNISMFVGFGLRAMAKIYDVYIDEHIPAIEERIIKLKVQSGTVHSNEVEHGNL